MNDAEAIKEINNLRCQQEMQGFKNTLSHYTISEGGSQYSEFQDLVQTIDAYLAASHPSFSDEEISALGKRVRAFEVNHSGNALWRAKILASLVAWPILFWFACVKLEIDFGYWWALIVLLYALTIYMYFRNK